MKILTFLEYIKIRIKRHGKYPDILPSHHLLRFIRLNLNNLERSKNATDLYWEIAWNNSGDTLHALDSIVDSYRKYCNCHGYCHEHVCRRNQ